jgi:hypothetical protein
MSLWLGLQVGLHCSWEGWCIDPCREGWRFVEGSVLRHMWKPISLIACDDCKWWEPWPLKISQGGGDFSWCITSTHSWRVVIRVYSLAVQVFGLHYFQFEDANSANTRYPSIFPFYSLDSLEFLALYIMLDYLSSRVLSRGVKAPYPSSTGRIILMSLPPLKCEYSANWANVLLIEPPLPIGDLVICSHKL